MPARTLARIVYKRNGPLWKSPSACLSSVRKVIGQAGDRNRRGCKPTHYREAGVGGNWMAKLPPEWEHFKDGPTFVMPGKRVLILSDLHIPYHDLSAVKAAIKYGRDNKADSVLLNGDIFDFFALSFWEKDPRKRNLKGEVEAGRAFLESVRLAFPKAEIVMKEGNHEERWFRYLASKAPELLDLDETDWPAIYQLDEHKILPLRERRIVKIGKMNVIHGHELHGNPNAVQQPARWLFLRAKTHALCGHYHRRGEFSAANLLGHSNRCITTGCLCKTRTDFSVVNEWNQSFAMVYVGADGAFEVDHKTVKNGGVY